MKRIPKLYEITGKGVLAKTILYLKIVMVVLVICICAYLITIFEDQMFRFILQAVAIFAINLIVLFNGNPILKIYPLSEKITYTYGLRNRVINLSNFKGLSLENDIMIQTKNDKRVIIRLDEFPDIDTQKLKDNFRAIFINKQLVKDVFFSNPIDGFNVVNKTILESQNPWPQVLLILSCFSVVLYLFYIILN